MRLLFILALSILFSDENLHAQQNNAIDTSFTSYFQKLPGIQNSAEEAWKVCMPKTKVTATKQMANELQAQLSILAERSEHQSYLLSWYANRLDKDSHYDLTKVVIKKDPVLEKAVAEANTDYFLMLNAYLKVINNSVDSLFKIYSGTTLAEKLLQVYQKEVPVLCSNTKKILGKIQQLMQSKGYNKILLQGDNKHPYFVQLLEVRGIFFDRLRELNTQADAANMSTAELVDYCKKDPVFCK